MTNDTQYDLAEAITARLREMEGVGGIHIGEHVPPTTPYPFIWLTQSGELIADDLCHPAHVEQVLFDVEIVSEDINETRLWTARVKKQLRTTALHSVTFENDDGNQQTVHGFDVDDHDNEYLPVNDGENVHIGALNVTVLMGT